MNRKSDEKVEKLLKDFNKDAEEDGLFDIDTYNDEDDEDNRGDIR